MSTAPLWNEPSPYAIECDLRGHPPTTYNPWADKTWCRCGAVIRDGQHEKDHWACCGHLEKS